MERTRPLQQEYDQYTAEDRRVWSVLFERQSALLQHYASSAYLDALGIVGFCAGTIPRFEDVNSTLRNRSGWELTVVPGHVPPAEFFSHLAARRFPATCWLRSFAELEYIEEPDMFHDVFGHVPLLADPAYADFMQAFGEAALTVIEDSDAIGLLSRFYWFTIEFGLLHESGQERIYGAGILSSPGETQHSMSRIPQRLEFDVRTVLRTAFRTDIIQDRYFMIRSFDELLPLLQASMELIHAGTTQQMTAPR